MRFETGGECSAVDVVELVGEQPGVFGVVDFEVAVWWGPCACQYTMLQRLLMEEVGGMESTSLAGWDLDPSRSRWRRGTGARIL